MKRTVILFFLVVLITSCTTVPPTGVPSAALETDVHPLPMQTSTGTYNPTATAALTHLILPIPSATLQLTDEVEQPLTRIAQMGGSISGISVIGDRAYVGMGPRIGVIDITRHDDPRLVSLSEPMQGLVTRLVQVSSHLLVVSAGKFLAFIDVSNPEEIRPFQEMEMEGGISSMLWDPHASVLYIGGAIRTGPGSQGLQGFITAIDFTLGLKLESRNSIILPAIPICIALGENGLFAGASGEQSGLYYVKVNSPGELTAPRLILASSAISPLVPSCMQVIGRELILSYLGLEGYDITDPEHPIKTWSGSVPGLNIAMGFAIDGDQAYLTGFSIREPDVLVTGTFTMTDVIDGEPMGESASITAMHQGDFIVTDRSFNIFSKGYSQELQLVGSYLTPATNATLAEADDHAIFLVDFGVGDGQSNSVLWALSLPDLKPLGHVTTELRNSWWEGPRSIALEGDRIYLASKNTVWVYDVGNPQPLQLGRIKIDEQELEAISALKHGDMRLLVTLQLDDDKYNVLRVYDITDSHTPIPLGNSLKLDQGSGAQMVWTGSALIILLETSYFSENDRLYSVGFGKDGLHIIRSATLEGYTGHVAANDTLILVTATSASMDSSTLSVLQPETFEYLSNVTVPAKTTGVAIVENTALVIADTTWDWGGMTRLSLFDLQNPHNPLQMEVTDIPFSRNYRVPILNSSPYVILINGAGGVDTLQLNP